MKALSKLIPPRVRITSKVSYEIVYSDAFPMEKQVGECRPNEPHQIVIKNGQSDTETFKTFLHEFWHSVSAEYPGINLTENQTLALEHATFKVLKLNKLI